MSGDTITTESNEHTNTEPTDTKSLYLQQNVIDAFAAVEAVQAAIPVLIPDDSEENAATIWKLQLGYIKLLKAAITLANTQEPFVMELGTPSGINDAKTMYNCSKRPVLINGTRFNYLDSGIWRSPDGITWCLVGNAKHNSAILKQAIGRAYRAHSHKPKIIHLLNDQSGPLLEEKIAASANEKLQKSTTEHATEDATERTTEDTTEHTTESIDE